VFDGLDGAWRARIVQEAQGEGAVLRRHATFDALDQHFRPQGAKGWQDWPAAFHDPYSADVARFAKEHAEDVAFHLFLQWLARESLNAVQAQATGSGMSIGLIGDLAVGVTPGGSDAWGMPGAMLRGLTIGAPPDPLGPLGQNWSITSFSPDGLRATGYAPWIAMVRSAMRASGGLRIDHAFGLARLWVIPDGGTSADGAYLDFPFEDLVRLATLEAHRANCLLIAEDLGTSPHGFTQAISERQMLGMRVLWFERAEDHGFIGAQDYPASAVAMTGTHDTQTVAGWWSGRDLDWAEELGRLPEGMDRLQAEEIRAWDRGLLWSTIGEGDRPAPSETGPVVDAAIAHVAATPAVLAIIPLEDLLGEVEQPNLPGTTTGHPNWQRRLEAPLETLLAAPDVRRRIDILGHGA
jgi:4-alpha-glucanotransferase